MSIAHFVATVQFLRNNYGPSHSPLLKGKEFVRTNSCLYEHMNDS